MSNQDVQRRTWNKEEYEARAKEREAMERAGKKLKTEEEKKKDFEQQVDEGDRWVPGSG